jgi:hypothetical protein
MSMTINISLRKSVALSVLLVALDVFARLTPHAPNFTPLAASALFASFLFGGGILAAAVPLVALAISDAVIGAYDWHIMAVVYSALVLPVLFGRYVRGNFGALRVVISALAASVTFFIATNFAVWYYASLYTRDVKGLLGCYAAALPFFRNTLTGDLCWSSVLFTAYAVARVAGSRPVFRSGHREPAYSLSVLGNQ